MSIRAKLNATLNKKINFGLKNASDTALFTIQLISAVAVIFDVAALGTMRGGGITAASLIMFLAGAGSLLVFVTTFEIQQERSKRAQAFAAEAQLINEIRRSRERTDALAEEAKRAGGRS